MLSGNCMSTVPTYQKKKAVLIAVLAYPGGKNPF